MVAIWVGVFLLSWGAIALHRRAFERGWQRYQSAFGHMRDVPQHLGNALLDRPVPVLTVVAVAGGILLLGVQWRIAEVTPPFQGPDEVVHLTNSFDGFYRLLGSGESSCPRYWVGLSHLFEATRPMLRRFTVQIDHDRLAVLQALGADRIPPIAGIDLTRAPNAHCALTNAFHAYAFNAWPWIHAKFGHSFTPMGYLESLRKGHVLISGLLLAFVALIIIKGRFVYEHIFSLRVPVVRFALLLAVLAYLAIPQNLFQTSVVSREAYMLPLGLLVTVSFFFRIPVFSLLFLSVAAYAFWPRRAVYLLPIALVVLTYFSVWLRTRKNVKWALWLPTGAVLIAFAATPWILGLVDANRSLFAFRIPYPLIPVEDPVHFYRNTAAFVERLWTLEFIQWRSFFGLLGSMDTPIADHWRNTFRWTLIAFASVGFAGMLTLKLLRNRGYSPPGAVADQLAVAATLILAVSLTVAVVTYAGYHIWYRPGREFGHAMQGRYFLPVYFPPVAYAVLIFFGPLALAKTKSLPTQSTVLGWVMLGGLFFLGITMTLLAITTLDTLIARYYLNDEVFSEYLSWLQMMR
jgi:hypothetical protein